MMSESEVVEFARMQMQMAMEMACLLLLLEAPSAAGGATQGAPYRLKPKPLPF